MKLKDFTLLSQSEKLEILAEEGIYLGKCKKYGYTSLLYGLHSFYIEITYYTYRLEINSITGFTDSNKLDPYLPEISLQELIPIL